MDPRRHVYSQRAKVRWTPVYTVCPGCGNTGRRAVYHARSIGGRLGEPAAQMPCFCQVGILARVCDGLTRL
jgi:hypothetical protein